MGHLALCQGLCERFSHMITDTGTMMPFPDATPDGGYRSGQWTRCSPAKLDVKPCHPNTKAIFFPGSFSSNLFGPPT